jgi:hypothetical protein
MRDEHKDTTFEVLLAQCWRTKSPSGLLDEGQKGAVWVTLTVVLSVGLKENLILFFFY